MTKSQRRMIVFLLGAFLLLGPILIMANCSGWNEGSMSVQACSIDDPAAVSLANLLYRVVFFSAFLAGAPIFLYLGLVTTLLIGLNSHLIRSYPGSKAPVRSPVRPRLTPREQFLVLCLLLVTAFSLGLRWKATMKHTPKAPSIWKAEE